MKVHHEKETNRDREKDIRRQELDDFNKVLSSVNGRRFVWRMLEKAGIFRTSFTGNSETFFREGMRNMGLMLMLDINSDLKLLDLYVLMLNEARKSVPIEEPNV